MRIVPNANPFLVLWFDSYPLSHSLFMLLVWAFAFGYLYRRRTGDRRAALVIGLLVVSHWVLDVITHRADMPLYPDGPVVGLGLWHSVLATVIVESVMLLAGVVIYLNTTRARDGIGRWGVAAMIVLLALSYYGSLFAAPPPNASALAVGGIIFGWVFVLFAWWVDRHRDVVPRLP